SRLLKHKAGPQVQPGTFPLEGDLAESWTQPTETTYIFKLRRGVRWHAKPPVNGRELTAEDVVYTVERFLTLKGNANAYMLASVAKVEPLDRHTVKFTLKEPFAWFLDILANPMAVAIIPKECVEKFGDLKKPESVVGTGPWMLESYRPNVGMTFMRNPNYFIPGLPHVDRVEMFVDEDKASRIAAFLTGKYDLGTEFVLAGEERGDARGLVLIDEHLDAVDVRQARDEVIRIPHEGHAHVRPVALEHPRPRADHGLRLLQVAELLDA